MPQLTQRSATNLRLFPKLQAIAALLHHHRLVGAIGKRKRRQPFAIIEADFGNGYLFFSGRQPRQYAQQQGNSEYQRPYLPCRQLSSNGLMNR